MPRDLTAATAAASFTTFTAGARPMINIRDKPIVDALAIVDRRIAELAKQVATALGKGAQVEVLPKFGATIRYDPTATDSNVRTLAAAVGAKVSPQGDFDAVSSVRLGEGESRAIRAADSLRAILIRGDADIEASASSVVLTPQSTGLQTWGVAFDGSQRPANIFMMEGTGVIPFPTVTGTSISLRAGSIGIERYLVSGTTSRLRTFWAFGNTLADSSDLSADFGFTQIGPDNTVVDTGDWTVEWKIKNWPAGTKQGAFNGALAQLVGSVNEVTWVQVKDSTGAVIAEFADATQAAEFWQAILEALGNDDDSAGILTVDELSAALPADDL